MSATKENVVAHRVDNDRISYVGLIPVFMDIIFATYVRMAYSPFRGTNGARSYRRDVLYATLREVVSGFNVAEGQRLTRSTDWVYKRIAESQRWKAHSIDLGNGAKGHWLGHSEAKYVMLYFHGGGYIAAATPGHLKYQFGLQHAIRKQGHDFSIFSLSYTLAPKKVYPCQISQANAALRYLLAGMNREPSTIIIAGDSAGANLASALLLHLARLHPNVQKLAIGKPLRAAVLISPWVSFSTTRDSFTRNKHSDCLTTLAIERASNTYIGPGGCHDAYSEPIRASPSWWSDVAGSVVKDMFIWGGGGEVLIDSIRDFAVHVQAGFNQASSAAFNAPANGPDQPLDIEQSSHDGTKHASAIAETRKGTIGVEQVDKAPVSMRTSSVTFIELPKMAHEEMILDYIIRVKGKRGARSIETWIDRSLKSPA